MPVLKAAKGTRDISGSELASRAVVIARLTRVFQLHGGQPLETPAFERRDLLLDKYGDNAKLVYDLADQGGESLALRYDLTVPFARHVAQRGAGVFRGFQVGRVWRRDQPQPSKGRYREFSQADFDIAGVASILADVEVVSVLSTGLSSLDVPVDIRVNHRNLLQAVMNASNVPAHLFKETCSSVDKMDKLSWDEVRAELIAKGLSRDSCETLRAYVTLKGAPKDLLSKLEQRLQYDASELMSFFGHLEAAGISATLDLGIARGLDYYTGVIFEAIPRAGGPSVAAGGRYDNLIGSLGNFATPAVGVSFGVDRLVPLVQSQVVLGPTAYVVSAGLGVSVQDRMRLATELRENGVTALYALKDNPSLTHQLQQATQAGAALAVIIGAEELRTHKVTIKDLNEGTQWGTCRTMVVDACLNKQIVKSHDSGSAGNFPEQIWYKA